MKRRETIQPTPVQWSEFARKGRDYADRIRAGESFAILRGLEVIAIVTPASGWTVSVTPKGVEG